MKKYIKVYEYYKKLIDSKQLRQGDRLPSIRNATAILNVSKTTVQSAYFALQADGYVIASAKSGYYVTEQKLKEDLHTADNTEHNKIKYDFKSGDADAQSFDIKLWQRYIKNALRQENRLLSYGDVQGEKDLRYALSDYIRTKRNVTASPDRIVVGAGVQSLLAILCSLIDEKSTVSFPDNSFLQGINLFKDYGFDVHTRYKNAKIIYVSPSHMTSYGNVMPMKRRLELIKHTEENKSLIIEDDFDSDFMYQVKPTPSLYALAGCDNVVYMGSFSQVLVPGIRISFMVLTEELAKLFNENKEKFAQAASKTEQIALCQYIRDGHINKQIRKIRRHYTAKTNKLYNALKPLLPKAKIQISENGLQVKITCAFDGSLDEFEKNSMAINLVDYSNGILKLYLTPSAVDENDIEKSTQILSNILKQ